MGSNPTGAATFGYAMYVIYSTYEEQDYGWGGWEDTTTKYFEVHGVAKTEDAAKQLVEKLQNDKYYKIKHEVSIESTTLYE